MICRLCGQHVVVGSENLVGPQPHVAAPRHPAKVRGKLSVVQRRVLQAAFTAPIPVDCLYQFKAPKGRHERTKFIRRLQARGLLVVALR